MEADAMRHVRTCVLTMAAFGLVHSEVTARGGDPDPAQVQAVAAIERVGGFVTPGTSIIPEGVVVIIQGTKATDDDLIHLGHLKSLCVLVLDGTKISDAGLVHLKELKNLRVLSLETTQITDAGLAHLKELKRLRELDLKGTRVTDAGIDHLKEMRNLRKLAVEETKISAEGIKNLRRTLWWCRIH
jgi:Leucine-rich repeat (LRR) protein